MLFVGRFPAEQSRLRPLRLLLLLGLGQVRFN